MNRAELEALLCEYLDGALAPAEQARVAEYLASHPEDAAWVEEARAGLAFLKQAPAVEPPPELITRILFETRAPVKASPAAAGGWRKWFGPLLEPVLQPRFVMGMAMTILSFSMLGRFAGMEVRQLRPADLHPARVWAALDDKAHRAWERAVKFYENLQLVYEAQNRLRDWVRGDEMRAQEAATPQTPAQTPGAAGGSQQGGKAKSPPRR